VGPGRSAAVAPDVHPAVRETAADIDEMRVRGAAAIADAAAAALARQAAESEADDADSLREALRAAARELLDTRPTAVSLPNALRDVLADIEGPSDAATLREQVRERAAAFRERVAEAQDELGRVGAGRLADGDVLMTHCHSTAVVACVAAARERGHDLSAYVTETRPRNQGHRTARELVDLGVDVTVVVDGAARHFVNDVDHVLVGADTVAADGSVVNKIGTCGLAANARDCGTPVTVAAGTLKLDPETLTGHAVEIEERDPDEVLAPADREAIGDVSVANPAFDVTPPRYVDAVVTERGQFPPTSVVTLMREVYGTDPARPWEA